MEGPSLVILREELKPFLNQAVVRVTGNTKQPKEVLRGQTLTKIDTWAKVIFLTFSSSKKKSVPIVIKTHFLMFGSYRIDDPKENRWPRLELKFATGTLYFYSCAIQFYADAYLKAVDRQVDLMSKKWNLAHVLKLMAKKEEAYLCDLFLDQEVFAGSGNIVKNEVLFNMRRHPLTKLSQVDKKDWPKLARAVYEYCLNFYKWKKKYELRKHWQVYRQYYCPLCERKLIKENGGKLHRRNFFCAHCQNKKLSRRRIKVFEVLPVTQPGGVEARLDH